MLVTQGFDSPHFHHFYIKTMINIFKYIIISILLLFLTGCVAISDKNEYEREVKGVGIDISFYPVTSSIIVKIPSVTPIIHKIIAKIN